MGLTNEHELGTDSIPQVVLEFMSSQTLKPNQLKRNSFANSLIRVALRMVVVFVLLFYSMPSSAHFKGNADITYKWISNGKYEVCVTVIYDCYGLPISNAFLVAKAGTTSLSFNWTTVTDEIISTTAPSCPLDACHGGSGQYGEKRRTVKYDVDISAYSACNWIFSWEMCCIDANVTTGQSNENYYTFVEVNKCIKNSSPEYVARQFLYLCRNVDVTIDQSVIDKLEPNDSFSYHLVPGQSNSTTNVQYGASFSAIRPLNFWGFPNQNLPAPAGFRLDPSTGVFTFRPTNLNQVAFISFEIKEWRKINGLWTQIGSMRRSFATTVIDCSNQNPKITNTQREFDVCVKDSFCFEIHTSDPDGDSTRVYWDSSFNGASWSTTNFQDKFTVGTFCWTPLNNAMVSDTPYVFSAFVYDDNCLFAGEGVATFRIYVRDSVDGVNVDLGPDILDSLGLDSIFLEGILTDYSGQSLQWSSSGDGNFSMTDSSISTYYPGPLDKKSCDYTLYLEAVDQTPCQGNSKLIDTLVVFNQYKKLDAGIDKKFFPGDTLSFLPKIDTSRFVSFAWKAAEYAWVEDSSNLNSRFVPGSQDVKNCTSTFILSAYGCDTVVDTFQAIRDYRQVNAGPDITVLPGGIIQLKAVLSTEYAQKGYWRNAGYGSLSDSSDPNATYLLAPEDAAQCSLSFVWEELPFADCFVNLDTLEVNIRFTGLNAGADIIMQVGDTAELQASPEIIGQASGYWTSLGDGVFSDSLDTKSNYIPGSMDKANCITKLIWHYPYPTCSQESDTLILEFINQPILAGPDQQAQIGAPLQLGGNTPPANETYFWTSTGDGVFDDSTSPSARYFPGTNDWVECGGVLIWNSHYKQCGAEGDTLHWTAIPFLLNAGGDIFNPNSDSIQLNALPINGGAVQAWWTSEGSGTFSDSLDPKARYYPSIQEKGNCEGKLYWNAPFSKCTPSSDSLLWKRTVTQIDAGPDQTLNLGEPVVLQAISSAGKVRWTSNGFGRFLDSSAKSTYYYPDSLDFPLCSLTFYIEELEAGCLLQKDSLQVTWKEEGIRITSITYDPCFMDTIYIHLAGNSNDNLQWRSTGSGRFEQDDLGNWIYLSSDADFQETDLFLSVLIQGYCFSASDSVRLPIGQRNQIIQGAYSNGPILLYPNPTKDWVTLVSDCPVRVISAELYDMAGKKIHFWEISELPYTISIESLASAVYMLRVKLEGGREITIPVTKYAE